MSRRSQAPSQKTAPTEHYFYGSSRSVASTNAHAPSVYVPTEDRIGIWVSQYYPVPPSHVSIAPSNYSNAGQRAIAPSHHSKFGREVVQATSNYARSQNWETQGLGYAQSNRAPVYYNQVTVGTLAPSQYFLDVRGNYINIATCPAHVLKELKKQKLELERAAERQTMEVAAGARQRAQAYIERISSTPRTQVFVERIIPAPPPAPPPNLAPVAQEQGESAFKKWFREEYEPSAPAPVAQEQGESAFKKWLREEYEPSEHRSASSTYSGRY